MQLTVEVQLLKSRQVQQTRGERLHAGGTDTVACNKWREEGVREGEAMAWNVKQGRGMMMEMTIKQ